MLWFLFCFCGSSDGFQRLRNRKHFIFRFDDHHHNKIVAISVIGCVIRMNGVPPRAAKDERYLKRESQRNGCPIRSNLPKEWVRSERLSNLLLVSKHVGTFVGIRLTAVIAPDLERTIEGRDWGVGICCREGDSMPKEKILPHMEEVVLAEHHPIIIDILPSSRCGFHRLSSSSRRFGRCHHGRSRLSSTSC